MLDSSDHKPAANFSRQLNSIPAQIWKHADSVVQKNAIKEACRSGKWYLLLLMSLSLKPDQFSVCASTKCQCVCCTVPEFKYLWINQFYRSPAHFSFILHSLDRKNAYSLFFDVRSIRHALPSGERCSDLWKGPAAHNQGPTSGESTSNKANTNSTAKYFSRSFKSSIAFCSPRSRHRCNQQSSA